MTVQVGSLVPARCHTFYSPGALTITTENCHAFSSYLEGSLEALYQIRALSLPSA